MGSDSLQKPDPQRSLIEKFQINRDKAFVNLPRFKPRSLKPWTLVSDLVAAILIIVWAIVWDGCAFSVTKFFVAPMLFVWTYILPGGFKDYLRQFNWAHTGFKVFSRILLAFYAWIAIALWYGSPWGPGGQWPSSQENAESYMKHSVTNYFSDFEGATVCNIKAIDLYQPLHKIYATVPEIYKDWGYCNSRTNVLKALSEGGRNGFGSPYVPQGCHYRWFSVEEICAILDRFDGVVFAGDQNLEMIYAGFNILLRKNLQHGALRPETKTDKLSSCACNSQFTDPSCHEWFVRSSKEVASRPFGTNSKAYTCDRMPHAFLAINHPPTSLETTSEFTTLVRPAPPNNYKSIPIIHSLTNDASIEAATESMVEFLIMADASGRKTPMLWVGPTAAGHIEIKGRKGNQEIWRFATEMARIAQEKDIETLGLWNLTVQANSYDGKGFGEDVSIVAAMMIVNWLARLPSS